MLYNVITIYLFNIQIYTFFLFEANIVSLNKISCASEEQFQTSLIVLRSACIIFAVGIKKRIFAGLRLILWILIRTIRKK